MDVKMCLRKYDVAERYTETRQWFTCFQVMKQVDTVLIARGRIASAYSE